MTEVMTVRFAQSIRNFFDLFFKIVGILAAFAAMEFFTLRPTVVLGSPIGVRMVKIDLLEQIYKDERKEDLPDPIRNMAQAYDSDARSWAESGKYSGFISPFTSPWSRFEPSPYVQEKLPPPEDWIRAAAGVPEGLDLILEQFGEWPIEPLALYVGLGAGEAKMGREDLQFAIDAAESAKYLLVCVPVSNMGDAVARNLVVEVQKTEVEKDFSAPESPKFDLAPDDGSITLTYEGLVGKNLDVTDEELKTWFAMRSPPPTKEMDIEGIKRWAYRLILIPVAILLWEILGPLAIWLWETLGTRTEEPTDANRPKRR